MAASGSGATGRDAGLDRALLSPALVIGLAVFSACLFGILMRPIGFLAMIWPANAVMLGLLLRLPGTRRASAWLAGALAYFAADLLSGTAVLEMLLLNAGNISGVAAGYLVCRYLPAEALRLREPASVLHILLVATVAAAAAGLAGAVTDPFLLRLGAINGGMLWFATELVNYVALLPVILSAPDPRRLFAERQALRPGAVLRGAVPALALVASCVLSMVVAGPGAIAFTVPALLWCGLVYPVFAVSVLTFLFSCWALTVMTAAYLPDSWGADAAQALVSIRLAAFMIALAPVTLSIVMRNREELVSKLSLARQRIGMAMEAGGIVATWHLNLADRDLTLESGVARLFEVDDKSGSGLFHDKLARMIHPDDRARVYKALGAAIATGTDYRCRCRIVTRSGDLRWLAAFGRTMRDGKGAASHLVGILVDVTEQAEAAEALEQSNNRFNIVSESLPQIVWSTDAEGRHDYFNCRWTEFTGIAPEDIRPETWKNLVYPPDRARVDQAWAHSLATGETYAIDYRFRYRDGSYRWLKVLARPLRNAAGAITRWYGTATDIDDAKQLEVERELVARELDHRIGNLFALVNGLVTITARGSSDVKTVTETLQGRLQTLHDAHGLIRRNRDGPTTTLGGLLRRLLAPYDNGGDRIAITGDDLPVAPVSIPSIALLFHELATNAVKYGALGHGAGRLRIQLGRNHGRFAIRWQEISPASVPAMPGRGSGFGSRLFETIIEGQLHGKAVRSLSDEGLTIEIELPSAALTGAPKS